MTEINSSSGFVEIPHTADWSIRVWAPEISQLFVVAAKGMYALMGVDSQAEAGKEYCLSLEGEDKESLLVAFLSELLYFLEEQKLAFDPIQIAMTEHRLEATMMGRTVVSPAKEIKAVTYYRLKIEETQAGFEVTITFDV